MKSARAGQKTGTWQAMSQAARDGWYHHMQKEHITPAEAGKLAHEAGAKTLILTHVSSAGVPGDDFTRLAQQAAQEYRGLIFIARDGMKFRLFD